MKTLCKEHKVSQCPSCSSDLSNQVLQPNNILIHYFNSNISAKCDRCEENPSTISCHNCMASFCKECSAFMHSQGVFTRHVLSNCMQLINNVDNLEICPTHKLPYKFYCLKDSLPLCRRCKETHSTHTIQNIENIALDHINQIAVKQDGINRCMNETKISISRCREALSSLNENYDTSKNMILNKFKNLKQCLQWKEEEFLGEIDNLYNRKKMEVEYFTDSLVKNEKKLDQSSDFINIAKKLQPNSVLSQIKYINHIIDLALEIDNMPISLSKSEFPSKLDTSSCQALIESLSLSEDAFSINTSISNSNILPPGLSSFTKSPSLRLKSNTEKSQITPIKSRSNSRDSSMVSQSLEENPLETRVFRKKMQSSTAIQVSWSHPTKSVPSLIYCLEYGVGTKLNNVEQFRQVYKGTAHTCIITDLLPKTSYRFRVAPILGDNKGDWSEIITVTTFDLQRVEGSTFGAHATVVTRAHEKYIQFEKPGIIFGANPCLFGKYAWEIKVFSNNLYSIEGNALRVGVSSLKSKVVHGADIDYQVSRGTVKIKVIIDMEAGTMSILNNIGTMTESVFSLPEGAVVPAIQYKPARSSTAPLRISVDFDV